MLVFDCLNQNSPQCQLTNPSAEGTHLEISNGRSFDDSIPMEGPHTLCRAYLKNASFPRVVNWLKFMPLQLMMFVTVHDRN